MATHRASTGSAYPVRGINIGTFLCCQIRSRHPQACGHSQVRCAHVPVASPPICLGGVGVLLLCCSIAVWGPGWRCAVCPAPLLPCCGARRAPPIWHRNCVSPYHGVPPVDRAPLLPCHVVPPVEPCTTVTMCFKIFVQRRVPVKRHVTHDVTVLLLRPAQLHHQQRPTFPVCTSHSALPQAYLAVPGRVWWLMSVQPAAWCGNGMLCHIHIYSRAVIFEGLPARYWCYANAIFVL